MADSNLNQSEERLSTHWMQSIDWSQGFSLAKPARFDREAFDPFGVGAAQCRVLEAGKFIGDTRRGGSCNVNQVSWIAHCHGTHTESISHIVDELIVAFQVIPNRPLRARVVSVSPCSLEQSHETYDGRCDTADQVITRGALLEAWNQVIMANAQIEGQVEMEPGLIEALVIRTGWIQASDAASSQNDFSPYFTNEAMRWIVDQGITHLLVESASVDRLEDDGRLINHRIFWQVNAGEKSIETRSRIDATITELIAPPAQVTDGDYALMLSVIPWELDAAPSQPILFRIRVE